MLFAKFVGMIVHAWEVRFPMAVARSAVQLMLGIRSCGAPELKMLYPGATFSGGLIPVMAQLPPPPTSPYTVYGVDPAAVTADWPKIEKL